MEIEEKRDTWRAKLFYLFLGTVVGLLVQEYLDFQRQLRENTQSFVVTFNGAYYGDHRDNLHAFFVSPEAREKTSGALTRQEYADWITNEVRQNSDLSASVFAVSEFYRTLNSCADDGRCSRASIENAFEPYAKIFYGVFYPALRDADCDLGFPDMEAATAQIAQLNASPDDRCSSADPYSSPSTPS